MATTLAQPVRQRTACTCALPTSKDERKREFKRLARIDAFQAVHACRATASLCLHDTLASIIGQASADSLRELTLMVPLEQLAQLAPLPPLPLLPQPATLAALARASSA